MVGNIKLNTRSPFHKVKGNDAYQKLRHVSSPGDGQGVSTAAAFWTSYKLEIESRGGASRRLLEESKLALPQAQDQFFRGQSSCFWLQYTRWCSVSDSVPRSGKHWPQSIITVLLSHLQGPFTLFALSPSMVHSVQRASRHWHLFIVPGHAERFCIFHSRPGFRRIHSVNGKLLICRHCFACLCDKFVFVSLPHLMLDGMETKG